MSDRHNGFVVVLEKPIKDEDSEKIKKAILMLRGVIKVKPIVDDVQSLCVRSQASRELSNKLWKVLYEEEGNE